MHDKIVLLKLADELYKAKYGIPGSAGQPKGVYTSDPIYSKVRVVADLRPDSTTKIFASATSATEQQADLQAFSYKRGGSAAAAGYGPNTTGKIRHTNLNIENKVPNSGQAAVAAWQISADPLKIPIVTTDVNTIADDRDNTSWMTSDQYNGDRVKRWLLQAFAYAYVPYVQQGDGQKQYLGKSSWHWDESAGLFVVQPSGISPEGWIWEKDGLLTLGFQLDQDVRNQEYVNDSSGPFAFHARGLDFALNNAKPAAKACCALLDLTVKSVSFRLDPRNG